MIFCGIIQFALGTNVHYAVSNYMAMQFLMFISDVMLMA